MNAILNSYKYNEWISFESTYLNGLRLPEKSDPETNYLRSVLVGVKVSQASKDYEQMMNKVPLEEKIELLRDELETPIIGDMIKTLTTFVAPMPMGKSEGANPYSVVNVEYPNVTIREKGEKTPVIITE